MTGAEIVDRLRERLDDIAAPQLWPTASLLAYANESEREACRRALLITDTTTASDSGTAGICSLPISSGTAGYSLSKKVLQVLRVKLPSDAASVASGTAGYGIPLHQFTRDILDKDMSDWENWTGTPEGFITEATNEIRFVPVPDITITASLIVKRLPLADFTLSTSPEIDEALIPDMLLWAMHLAYLKNDSDTMNLQLAEYYETKFTAAFGPRPTFRDLLTRRENVRGGSMRYRTFGG
jgi:hypothetical protein